MQSVPKCSLDESAHFIYLELYYQTLDATRNEITWAARKKGEGYKDKSVAVQTDPCFSQLTLRTLIVLF